MKVVSYPVAKFLFDYGYRGTTLYTYSKTGKLEFWFENNQNYPAPTYEDAIEFLWNLGVAQIYYIPFGTDCKGVMCIPKLGKLFTTKRKFKIPREAYDACLRILITL